jgi:hypothetical protein
VQTLAALIITSVLVRLILIILVPDLMIAYDSNVISFAEFLTRLLASGGGTGL